MHVDINMSEAVSGIFLCNLQICVLQVQFLDDVRQVLHVIWLFIPLPVFWALYDQQVYLLCYWHLLPDTFSM